MPSPPHTIVAPTDDEVYEYLGPQMRWIQFVLLVAFGLAAWSMVAFATAHPSLWPALIVLVINAVSTVLSLVTGLGKRRLTWRSHQQRAATWVPDGGRFGSVDVFLPTCGEELEILRNTYTHVSALAWPGRLDVHVLDDADRPQVAGLASEFGFEYLVRPDRGYLRKAGNLRYAFERTRGDVVVIFDADFCPRHDFLAHLMPYLDDPQVAIVQSPQSFATTEQMGWIERTAGATQEFFYRWVLPSRDRLRAANCVGTSALYRRSALARIGGFTPIEHSEDLHTGRHLQRAGYRIRYVPVVLSRGLCPTDLAGFLNQQYRWCMGTLSRTVNPVLEQQYQRMTVRQALAHWAGVFYYLTTALNVFLFFVPGVIMLAAFPADIRPAQLVPFLFGFWVYVVVFPLLSRTRWRFEVLRIQMAYSFAHAVAIVHKLIGREIGWVPTGAVGVSNALARSISALGTVSLGLSLIGFWAFAIIDVADRGWSMFWMMVGFACVYSYLAVPLLVEFVRVLVARRRSGSAGSPAHDDSDAAPAEFLRPPTVDRAEPAPQTDSASQGESADEGESGRFSAGVSASDGLPRPPLTARRPTAVNWNRITAWEVVGFTLSIALIAAVALGAFAIMLPWTAS
ncbi:putative cellulose synthase (UDP-forming), glycosyl transferase family 2 [Gordonia polyisoprenivorans VH2]|uniref:Putative cellulose synthase (UDP-forming), glycosyl transferase family 2 n=2 Tax=Gordonia polyisoprenivorans TaxID=84595 RepID=H6N1F5_GORPV|nr:putative cellulose synthase (UDP-forming), glycosyl transferase family 2 [Gordonia polyisoprenivorans VH2]